MVSTFDDLEFDIVDHIEQAVEQAVEEAVEQAVDGHNKTKLSQSNTSDENTCNCRNKKRCPMNGKCLVKSLVYQATVTTDDNRPSQTYVGLTENTFKTRFNNHKAS